MDERFDDVVIVQKCAITSIGNLQEMSLEICGVYNLSDYSIGVMVNLYEFTEMESTVNRYEENINRWRATNEN